MIRNLQESDLQFCANILEKEYSKNPYNETFKNDNVLRYVKSKFENNKETCFVLEENNKIVGFCCSSMSYWTNGLQGIIEEIVIDSDFQGKGFGRELYFFVENYLKSLGVKSLMLWVQNDAKAFGFHLKNGFFKSEELGNLGKCYETYNVNLVRLEIAIHKQIYSRIILINIRTSYVILAPVSSTSVNSGQND